MIERGRPVAVAMFLFLCALGPADAEQIVDATVTWFPSDAPPEWSNQVTAGDLDGDGDLDLVFANGGNFSTPGANEKVRVYINVPGSSRFRDQSDERTGGLAGIYRGVELGDCDGDGDLDILLAQDFNRLPGLLLNDGSGTFSSEGAARLPAITLSSSRGQFADVDNDGDLDVFFPSGTANRFDCGQYRLYLNDGSCHYGDATSTNFPLGAVCQNMDAIFGDIDGDFDLDLRTASTGTNNSRTYRNNGAGVFTIAAGFPADNNAYSYDFGDIDRDGDLDLIGANAATTSLGEILLENNGSGGYADVSSQIVPNPSQDDNDSKFFDYDNDGDLDLIVARLGSGGEKLYQNDGNGNFSLTSGVVEVLNDSSLDLIVADFDQDGSYDIVTAQGESGDFTNRIYLNNGPADTFPPRIVDTETQTDTFDGGPYAVRAAILDDMTSDRNFFDGGITLHYSANGGTEATTPMRYSGGQIYRGTIPGQPGGTAVAYHVTAADRNGNSATGPERFFAVLGNAVAAGDLSAPLMLAREPGGPIEFSWGASCLAGDLDFAIYTGPFASFESPVLRQCTTGGATSVTFFAPPGNRYYLVVPHNGVREGSYGAKGGGAERAPAAAACFAQLTGDCR